MGVRRHLAGMAPLVLLTMGCGSATTNTSTTTTQSAPVTLGTGTGKVTISGNLLLKDGAQWTPKALQLNAFVASPAVGAGVYLQAYQHFTLAELSALQAWGADTVRFQIGQPEMDPQSPLYTASFVAQVQAAVTQARALGLNVILSVQDEGQTGETAPSSLPDAGTSRDGRRC